MTYRVLIYPNTLRKKVQKLSQGWYLFKKVPYLPQRVHISVLKMHISTLKVQISTFFLKANATNKLK